MSEQATYICPQCQIGHLQPSRQTFVRVYGGMIVSIPDMPAFVCDVCAYQEFEPAALAHVEALVGAARPGKPVTPRPVAKTPPPDGGSSPSLKS